MIYHQTSILFDYTVIISYILQWYIECLRWIGDTDMILKSKVGLKFLCNYIKAAYALLDLEIKEWLIHWKLLSCLNHISYWKCFCYEALMEYCIHKIVLFSFTCELGYCSSFLFDLYRNSENKSWIYMFL